MKYKSIYKTIEGVVYTGYNYNEVNKFTDFSLAYNTECKDWEDSNPPKDLRIILRPHTVVEKGDVVIKLPSGEFKVLNEDDFNYFFKEEK